MILDKLQSLVSFGDFVDLYYKFKFKGIKFLFSKFSKFSYEDRVSSKWDLFTSQSDFWVIPQIKKDWNFKISGNENITYETYVYNKYLGGKDNLKLISIGCGEGNHERNFAEQDGFSKIIGVDVSKESISQANKNATANNLNIEYHCLDFIKMDFKNEQFDLVLFDSSLHHFDNINGFLKDYILPVLSNDGILVVFEYCGPNRLSWRKSQLNEANRILKELPPRFKTLLDGKSLKRKVYRPGLIRMLLVDPSEAPDSANLVVSLNENFDVLEEKRLGWNISHLLLKGISHNFLNKDIETERLLKSILEQENEFIKATSENDAIFGVYKKKNSVI